MIPISTSLTRQPPSAQYCNSSASILYDEIVCIIDAVPRPPKEHLKPEGVVWEQPFKSLWEVICHATCTSMKGRCTILNSCVFGFNVWQVQPTFWIQHDTTQMSPCTIKAYLLHPAFVVLWMSAFTCVKCCLAGRGTWNEQLGSHQQKTATKSQSCHLDSPLGQVCPFLPAGRAVCNQLGAMSIEGDAVTFRVTDLDGGIFGCLKCGSSAEIVVPCAWVPFLAKGSALTVRDYEIQWAPAGPRIIADEASVIFIHPSQERGPVHFAEFFAGIGGWTSALKHFGAHALVLVERDPDVARVCAARFHSKPVTVEQLLQAALNRNVQVNTVVVGDVTDRRLWMALGLLNCGLGMSSPPCQPWSTAAYGKGLASPDGEVMKTFLERAGEAGWMAMLLENVPGFRSHEDFHAVIAHAKHFGLELILGGVQQISAVLPVNRERWLATFVNTSVVRIRNLVQAKDFDFKHPSLGLHGPGPSMSKADVLLHSIPPEHAALLTISDDARLMLCDLSLLPDVLKGALPRNPKESDVMCARVISASKQLVGIMAAYGAQHELPVHLLKAKGLKTCLFANAPGDFRYFSPWEIIAAMGHDATIVLPSDVRKAWQIAGNTLSPVHAFLQLTKTQIILGETGLVVAVKPWLDVLQDLLHDVITMSTCRFEVIDGLWRAQSLPEYPASKRVRTQEIEPTVPFQITDADKSVVHPEDTAVVKTSKLAVPVDFHQSWTFTKVTRGASSFVAGGLTLILHCEGHWLAPVHSPLFDTVERLITRTLPHAEPDHFLKFWHRDEEVQWDTCISCKQITRLVFEPVLVRIRCVGDQPVVVLECDVDVAWKGKTLLAVAAMKLCVHPDALRLSFKGLRVQEDDYVLEFQTREFKLGFQAIMPCYFAEETPRVVDDGLRPSVQGFIRLYGKHPACKLFRGTSVRLHVSLLDAVKGLFPELTVTCPFSICNANGPLAHDMSIQELVQSGCFEIHVDWGCLRPLAVTWIFLSQDTSEPGSLGFSQQLQGLDLRPRWIRSPFRSKPVVLELPDSLPLLVLANGFVCHSQMTCSITVHAGSRVLDPSSVLGDVSVDEVISFKIGALPGGGKGSNQDSRGRIKKCLQDRGVPSAEADARVAQLLNKVSLDSLLPLPSHDEALWDVLKEAANECKFRLVQHAELRAFNKGKRSQKPPSKNSGRMRAHGFKNEPSKVIKAEDVVLNPKHFWDGTDNVEVLALSRFGPDLSGVVVVNCQQAAKYEDVQSMSTEALAMLIVDRDLSRFSNLITVPAHDKGGTPVVVTAALIQCGDRDVEFRPSVPSLVDTIEATVVEFSIIKDMVPQWADVAAPLNYLGTHVPALRGNALLSTWAIKPFNAARQACQFREAVQFHGFFKVNDSILEAILSRSGKAGIFMAPKTSDKKYDPRFPVVPLPAVPFAEVVNRASQAEVALGIAKFPEHFGVRCRKADLPKLRQILLPESTFVDASEVTDDMAMFILRRVPVQVGKNELTLALSKAGWEAVAIRPQGDANWLLGSKFAPPCSHLCINNALTIVEPVRRDGTSTISVIASEHSVSTETKPGGSAVVTSTTRIQEVRAELQAEVSNVVDQKLAGAFQQIASLQGELAKIRVENQATAKEQAVEIAAMKDEQAFVKAKMGDIEASVSQQSSTILTQMQSMMNAMQSNLQNGLEQAIDAKLEGDSKRTKLREDGFASKSWLSHSERAFPPVAFVLFFVSLIAPAFAIPCCDSNLVGEGKQNLVACQDFDVACPTSSYNTIAERTPFPLSKGVSVDFADHGVFGGNVAFQSTQLSDGGQCFFTRWSIFVGLISGARVLHGIQWVLHFFGIVSVDLWMDEFQPAPFRFGEALHPGPVSVDRLRCGNLNPAQLLNNEQVVADFGPGVWSVSETSHTASARCLMQKRFRDLDLHTVFGPDVSPHVSGNAGTLRGKASGVAVVSSLPISRYPVEVPHEVAATCRFLDTLVMLSCHISMYVSVLYGPVHGTFQNTDNIFQAIFGLACDRAAGFSGPAMITGDLNRPVSGEHAWERLRRLGWWDVAELWHEITGVAPSPTCRDQTRHSFILINRHLVQHVIDQGLCDDFSFDAHPVLYADFRVETVLSDRYVWALPRSTDEYLFDSALLDQAGHRAVSVREGAFDKALSSGNMEQALRQFALAFDDCIQASCVNVEGAVQPLPRACLGRCRQKLIKRVAASAPRVRPARAGDFSPAVCQTSTTARQWVRQVRRLQSLHRQLQALERRFTLQAAAQVQTLWDCVLNSPGFAKGFYSWCLHVHGWFLPCECPHAVFVQSLTNLVRQECDLLIRSQKKFQWQVRQAQIANDMLRGGAFTCRSLKDPALPPISHFVHEVQIPVARVRWTKAGRDVLVVGEPMDAFDLRLPVVFHGQAAHVVRCHGKYVYLDRRVKCKSGLPLVLLQKQPVMDIATMHQTSVEQWGQLWMREPENDNPQNWDQVMKLVDGLPDFPRLSYVPFTEELWQQSLRGVKRGSARGADGFSIDDIRMCPPCLNKWIFQMFEKFEDGFPWPAALSSARAVLLPKGSEAPVSPMQTRPITIMGRLYRLWSRTRAKQSMQHLCELAEVSVLGAACGASADVMAARILDEIEEAMEGHMGRAGLVVDIIKAFNAIPRLPLFSMLLKLGIPEQYIKGFWAALASLRRHLEVAGQASGAVTSTTGVPEGCAYSVVSMLAVTICASCVVDETGDITPVFYADNWSLLADSVQSLSCAAERLQMFADMLRMQISRPKSWFWGSTASLRRQLRDLKTFQVKHFEADLGCDVTYIQRPTKKVTRKRWGKAIRVMDRLAHRRLQKNFKIKLINTMGWSTASFGSELVTHAKHEWRSIRAAVCRAAGRAFCGANPFLACSVSNDVVDPQCADLLQKAKFWRRYFRLFPDRRCSFLNRLASPDRKSKVGPSISFIHAFSEAGWVCKSDGWIEHCSGLSLHWTSCSLRHLKNIIKLAWSHFVCASAGGRKHFNLTMFDGKCLGRLVRELPVVQQGYAVSFMIGRHVTRDVLHKYSKRVHDDLCNLCGQQDSKEHRFFRCRSLQDNRRLYRDDLRWLQSQGLGTQHFCCLQFDLRPVLALQKLPWDYVHTLPCDDGLLHILYCDGSAFFNTNVYYTVAGAAVIEIKNDRWKLVTSQLVPGHDHTPHRSEIWGIILALQTRYRVHLHCDCQSVLAVVRTMLQCRLLGFPPTFHDNHDLWHLVWVHLLRRRPGDVEVTKVKAHTAWRSIADPVERAHGRYSDAVDRAAKKCVRTFLESSNGGFERAVNKSRNDSQHLLGVLKFWCETSIAAQAKPQSGRDQFDRPVFVLATGDVLQQGVEAPGTFEFCPFTALFQERIFDWLAQLTWFHGGEVSLLELYCDFTIWSGTLAPVPRYRDPGFVDRKLVPKYSLRDQCVVADTTVNSLATQNLAFSRFMQWCVQTYPGLLPCPISRGTKSASRVGYPYPCVGFQASVAFAAGVATPNHMWDYFHPRDKGTVRSLKGPWHSGAGLRFRHLGGA